jgi:hypothetical protein
LCDDSFPCIAGYVAGVFGNGVSFLRIYFVTMVWFYHLNALDF